MSEFKDFVDECGLETKSVNFDLMTNMFIKANATNSAQVRDQHAESRRSAETKMDHMMKGDQRTTTGRTAKELAKVKGKSDGGEAKKDQELVLYEFINMLVRIAFQRANPTFGNFADKRPVKHLPGCLRTMIEDEILPRARTDTSAVFRETVMTELSVLKVLDDYRGKLKVRGILQSRSTLASLPSCSRVRVPDTRLTDMLLLALLKAWYTVVTADDTGKGGAGAANPSEVSDKLQLEQWKEICVDPGQHCEQDLVGIWQCYRESDITGDPACRTEFKWRLSMPQIKMAFLDSQPPDSLQAAQTNATVCC